MAVYIHAAWEAVGGWGRMALVARNCRSGNLPVVYADAGDAVPADDGLG